MTSQRLYSGINIQYPISRLILDGKKVIETRTYPIPKKFIGIELALVETPGKTGKFKARIVAKIVFGPSFQYISKRDFYAQASKHCVEPGSPWEWNPKKEKWGWPIISVTPLSKELPVKKRCGIQYTSNLAIPIS